jgi:hypothetical protein
MPGSGIRQYDIWIDGHKLAATFVRDDETRAGHRVLLSFDGRVMKIDRSTLTWLDRSECRGHFAKLGGTALEFQLKDDASGRRVLIASTCEYLQWAELHDDGTQGPFVRFPTHPLRTQAQLAFGRTYVFQDAATSCSSDADCVPTAPTMTLSVTDPLAGLEV